MTVKLSDKSNVSDEVASFTTTPYNLVTLALEPDSRNNPTLDKFNSFYNYLKLNINVSNPLSSKKYKELAGILHSLGKHLLVEAGFSEDLKIDDIYQIYALSIDRVENPIPNM